MEAYHLVVCFLVDPWADIWSRAAVLLQGVRKRQIGSNKYAVSNFVLKAFDMQFIDHHLLMLM